ncbi:MAG: OmpA family protein [Polyangiaceae bacterium]
MRSGIGAIACALSLFGIEATAGAQSASGNAATPALALDRFYPAPPGDRMFGVESAAVGERSVPLFSVVADYAHDPLVLQTVRTSEDRGRVIGDQLFLHLQAGVALQGRLYLSASFPVALLQDGASPTADGAVFTSPSGAAVGDLRLGLRLRIFGLEDDPFQVAIAGYLWVPTGGGAAGTYVSDGNFRGLPRLVLGGRVGGRFLWGLNGGIDVRSSRMFGGNNGVSQGSMARFDGGLGFLLLESRALQLGVEGSAAFLLENKTNVPIEHATNLEVLFGGKYRVSDFEIGAGAGPGLTSGIGTPDVRALATIAFAPVSKGAAGPLDLDKDGIADDKDACPGVAGALRADAKVSGCPDADADGIVDLVDACPRQKGLERQDPKKNGCPDMDTDEDGLPDLRDACPTVKGPERDDAAASGCPDTDGDGVLDQNDACPTLKGLATADERHNGCPDADGDGIPDNVDACPDKKGAESTDAAKNGCPADTDGDGILNDKDACPEEKGDADPDAKQNGCPKAVRVTGTEIVILQEVQFDSARSSIKMVSNPLLDEVASVLKQHPEIRQLEVQGHTDDQGKADYNKRLSQDRADSVRQALVQRGIAEVRLVANGYGQEKPIADNKTIPGREKNRRVQFVILRKGP